MAEYTYIFRLTGGTTSSTAGQWLPFFSVKPGDRSIRISGLMFDPNVQLYALVVRRGSATTTGGGSVTPFAFTLDTTTPAFSAIWSASGSLTATRGNSDKEVFRLIGGITGQPKWATGDSVGLEMAAYTLGSLDVYVASPSASASFNIDVIVDETTLRRVLKVD